MKTIEVECVWTRLDDNLERLEEMGITVSPDEKEDTGIITLKKKYIAAFNPTTNPNRTRVWMAGGLGDFMINLPYAKFKELYYSTSRDTDEIVEEDNKKPIDFLKDFEKEAGFE